MRPYLSASYIIKVQQYRCFKPLCVIHLNVTTAGFKMTFVLETRKRTSLCILLDRKTSDFKLREMNDNIL